MRQTIAVFLALFSLSLAACGEEDEGSDSAADKPAQTTQEQPEQKPEEEPTTTEEEPEKPDPQVCLMRGGATKVWKNAPEIWNSVREEGGGMNVELFGSKAEAAQVVRDATDIDAAAAGRYAVLGPLKGGGAKEDVEIVADCLKNG